VFAWFALSAWALSGAPGQDDGAWLRWQAPSECPDAAVLSGRIAALAGRSVSDDDPATVPSLQLAGEITRSGDGYRLQLRVTHGDEVDARTLDAEHCETLTEAAALVASVGWDPVATVHALELPSADDLAELPEPLGDPVGVPREVRPPTRSGTRVREQRQAPRAGSRERTIAWWLRARGGVGVGVVPRVDALVDLALGIGTSRVRGELLGAWASPRTIGADALRLRVQLGSVTPRVCATLPQGRIDLVACGGVALGAMRGVRAEAAGRVVPWIAAHAEVGLRIVVTPRLSAWLSAVIELPLRYPRFVVHAAADAGRTRELFRPQVAGLRGIAGLEVRLRGVDKRQ
jgi:hypothetical protein